MGAHNERGRPERDKSVKEGTVKPDGEEFEVHSTFTRHSSVLHSHQFEQDSVATQRPELASSKWQCSRCQLSSEMMSVNQITNDSQVASRTFPSMTCKEPVDSSEVSFSFPSPRRQQASEYNPWRSTVESKPCLSLSRLLTYDGLRSYQEEKAAWSSASTVSRTFDIHVSKLVLSCSPDPCDLQFDEQQLTNKFRNLAAEIGFCFTIAVTQFLAEYLISGFAIELPKIIGRQDIDGMGRFWPASLLSLILSAMLLIFARVSDMYGGYLPFMFGVVWLGIWSIVAGRAKCGALLDVARAMQGLAIAAFTPSAFAMVGSIYREGPRKNIVLGIYSGCAPVGFFAGFLVAGALPDDAPGWYFYLAAALSGIVAISAWLTVPYDRTDRKQLKLKMDWNGAFLITAGLIPISYALAVEPYATGPDRNGSGCISPGVLAPLLAGLVCLLAAFWVEGWHAECPLLPFEFFRPRSTMSFSLACLCFYATYGVWLYKSAQFLQSASATGTEQGIHGVTLAVWYTPTAIAGLTLCVVGGALLHVVPITGLLLLSAAAWIVAPLLFALCPMPVSYWTYIMPSMLCATLGIDLTFTISVVFLSSVEPLRYQGLAGAVSSILVNLAMSFSLSIAEIVSDKAKSTVSDVEQERLGFQWAFLYAASSAGLGFIICALFVRITPKVVQESPTCKGSTGSLSEASTFCEV